MNWEDAQTSLPQFHLFIMNEKKNRKQASAFCITFSLSQAIRHKIRQRYLSRVVGIKLTEMIADLQYIFLPYLSHLFELVNYVLCFTEIRIKENIKAWFLQKEQEHQAEYS